MSLTNFLDVRKTIKLWIQTIRINHPSFKILDFGIIETPSPSMMIATNENMTYGYSVLDFSPWITLHIRYKNDSFNILLRFKNKIDSFIIRIYEIILERRA